MEQYLYKETKPEQKSKIKKRKQFYNIGILSMVKEKRNRIQLNNNDNNNSYDILDEIDLLEICENIKFQNKYHEENY